MSADIVMVCGIPFERIIDLAQDQHVDRFPSQAMEHPGSFSCRASVLLVHRTSYDCSSCGMPEGFRCFQRRLKMAAGLWELEGAVVTIEAMGCPKASAHTIPAAGADDV